MDVLDAFNPPLTTPTLKLRLPLKDVVVVLEVGVRPLFALEVALDAVALDLGPVGVLELGIRYISKFGFESLKV